LVCVRICLLRLASCWRIHKRQAAIARYPVKRSIRSSTSGHRFQQNAMSLSYYRHQLASGRTVPSSSSRQLPESATRSRSLKSSLPSLHHQPFGPPTSFGGLLYFQT
jgi:hypothetical protein